jgi:hypothetical protein
MQRISLFAERHRQNCLVLPRDFGNQILWDFWCFWGMKNWSPPSGARRLVWDHKPNITQCRGPWCLFRMGCCSPHHVMLYFFSLWLTQQHFQHSKSSCDSNSERPNGLVFLQILLLSTRVLQDIFWSKIENVIPDHQWSVLNDSKVQALHNLVKQVQTVLASDFTSVSMWAWP